MPNFAMSGWSQQSPVRLSEAFGLNKGTFRSPRLTAQLPAAVDAAASTQAQATAAPVVSGSSAPGSGKGSDGTPAGNKALAFSMAAAVGWGTPDQLTALDNLWTEESGFRTDADNPTSGAWGIPQALPASKMAANGPDWKTNPVPQIAWGLGYIRSRYGNPVNAWAF